ncbi:uncharacterized protein LOC108001001 [Apis cerana]|uniref:Transmembrane protein n=1 Tax=Apis cerana cerana TaxID=94128 RepID=A0A2A3EJF7_APICC|nr:uncharacterized protein LOC108001001 [Apis cerana]XP_016917263.1 uncharacterized protein LOC108001001 [Apis cerana]PBC31161.1 hypothetical protein APICC_09224 [Apis cerana cerana]
MTKVSGMVETEDVVGKPTFVRRVSNMLKDGSYSEPPMLFRHASMQKIRHCCQNLNLLPYLLYSFDNSKSHPIARKVHNCLGQFLQIVTTRIFLIYKSFRRSLLCGIRSSEFQASEPPKTPESCKFTARFRTTRQLKRKQNNRLILTLGVYFAPLFLFSQLVGLFCLMIFGKYTPGFIFLISALLFLAYISFKVLFHDIESTRSSRRRCRKIIKAE